ncbi:MAG: VOC family protein [Actinomycetota bacterium]
MTDQTPDPVAEALDGLYDDATTPAPRADFARELRARVVRALAGDDDPTGSNQTEPSTKETTVNHGSLFYSTLPAPDLERTARFYRGLFGWNLQRGANGYHVADVYPPMGLASGDGAPQVWIEVAEVAPVIERIRELGGTAEDPVTYDSGEYSACVDSQGVRFNVQVPADGYRQPARRSTEAGELFYWTLPAPDAVLAKTFYTDLFGWEFGDPGSAGGMHVENRLPDGGLGGGREGTGPELFFRVDDLDAAMAKVVELGGTAMAAGEGDEGRHAMCTDDQGVPFGISEPAPGA